MMTPSTMTPIANIDGRIVPADEARIPILDHGFLFGDSVYEVIRTHRGIPFACREHLDRLARSAARLELSLPLPRFEITERIVDTLREFPSPEAAIRVIVTRGVGEIDIDPSSCASPSVLIVVRDLPSYPPVCHEEGVAVAICSIERTGRRATDPAIKSGNYLNSVLALMEAQRQGCFEGLMLNAEGHVTEGSTSNVFFVRGSQIHTPSAECGILSGITRALVLELAAEADIPFEEGRYRAEDLAGANEAWLTSTTKGVMPIRTVDGTPLSDSNPGPVTTALRDALEARLETDTGHGDLDEFLRREDAEIPTPLFLDQHLVTNAHYKRFVDETDHRVPRHWKNGVYPLGKGNHPVVFVSWEDAAAFAGWCGKRLPREEEWERAAAGDDPQRSWPWGDEFDDSRCNCRSVGIGDTTPVDLYPDGRSDHGCFDMIGNVWEWTDSWYDVGSRSHRVLRGGSWFTYAEFSYIGYRNHDLPHARSRLYGIRCCRSFRRGV